MASGMEFSAPAFCVPPKSRAQHAPGALEVTWTQSPVPSWTQQSMDFWLKHLSWDHKIQLIGIQGKKYRNIPNHGKINGFWLRVSLKSTN